MKRFFLLGVITLTIGVFSILSQTAYAGIAYNSRVVPVYAGTGTFYHDSNTYSNTFSRYEYIHVKMRTYKQWLGWGTKVKTGEYKRGYAHTWRAHVGITRTYGPGYWARTVGNHYWRTYGGTRIFRSSATSWIW